MNEEKIGSEWYKPFFSFIRNNKDAVKAVSYINADWDNQSLWAAPYQNGYWGDSRVQDNLEISKKWLTEIGDKSFWD